MYELTDSEHDGVTQLNAEYRKAFMLNKFAAYGVLYLLADADGPFMLADSEKDEEGTKSCLLPVWPHERFTADFAAAENLSSMQVREVSAALFQESWLPVLRENGIMLALLPLSGDSDFCVIDPEELTAETA